MKNEMYCFIFLNNIGSIDSCKYCLAYLSIVKQSLGHYNEIEQKLCFCE